MYKAMKELGVIMDMVEMVVRDMIEYENNIINKVVLETKGKAAKEEAMEVKESIEKDGIGYLETVRVISVQKSGVKEKF